MDRDEHLKELFQTVFQKNGVSLYELKWLSQGRERTLQVAITKPDGTMDLDTCAAVSEQISEILDKDDLIKEEYTLEVCSPGAEREIRDPEELKHIAGKYVHVRLKEPYKNLNELTGEVKDMANGIVHLLYRDKAATRTAEFKTEDIEYIRYAVKL
jgi:ribosome maturation factor RimP